MKLGCAGCLSTLVGLALVALVLGAAVGVGSRLLAQPAMAPAVTTAADGSRAQQKLFELTRRRRGAAETVVITEPEINALLTRHLVEARGVQLGAPSARLLGADRLEVMGSRPLGRILEEISLGSVGSVLPARWLERPIWLRIGAHIRVEERSPRHLRLDVDALVVGRQRVPALALRLLMDPGGVGLLRWPLPSHIESVTIEPGRAIIKTTS
jgi:hypothetical protein